MDVSVDYILGLLYTITEVENFVYQEHDAMVQPSFAGAMHIHTAKTAPPHP